MYAIFLPFAVPGEDWVVEEFRFWKRAIPAASSAFIQEFEGADGQPMTWRRYWKDPKLRFRICGKPQDCPAEFRQVGRGSFGCAAGLRNTV